MNRRLESFVILVVAFGPLAEVGQASAQWLTAAEVREVYPEIFQLRQGEYGSFPAIGELREDHPLSGLVEEAGYYLGYLFSDAAPFVASPDDLTDRVANSPKLDQAVLRTVDAFLKGRGGGLVDYRSEDIGVLPISEVAHLATRFFYLDRYLPDGRSAHRMCAGSTGYRGQGMKRVLEVEAFVYAAYFGGGEVQEALSESYFSAFSSARRGESHESSAADLDALRMRTWELLERDERFREALLEAYELKRHYLPFRIADGQMP